MSHSQGGGGGGGGFFSFPPPPNGFDDRTTDDQDKMRFHGYESSAAVYDSAGMLSEMFDFGGARPSVAAAPAELLGLVDQQNAGDSAAAAAMHHFFTNPPPRDQPHALVLPDQGFHAPQFTWIHEGTSAAGGMAVEGQGLSLSLASSLEAEELRMRTTGVGYGAGASTSHEMMFFNATQEPRAAASSSNSYQQLHFGFNTTSSSVFSLAAVNVLRNSKYTRPAQELLEEFCSVGRGHHKKTNLAASGNNPTASTSGSGGGPTTKDLPPLSPADRMEHQRRKVKLATMLDEVERRYIHYCEQMQMVVNSFEMVMGLGAAVPYTALAQKAMSRHFRCLKEGIQAELRRSCELLGEKADVAAAGITKGETPRLKVLEQSLRKQRAFHQMGIMEQEAWRPQRGLPERSVNVLRAWLFEHFLHPYPSDADKHLLARQTGLSRNQVANWFINARVRLWKPMIEEMYQQESKERGEEEEAGQANVDEDDDKESSRSPHAPTRPPSSSAPATTTTLATRANTSQQINDSDPSSLYMRHHQQTPTAATSVGPTANAQGFIQADTITTTTTTSYSHVDACNHFGTSTGVGGDSSAAGLGPTMIRFGTTPTAGDVSLTLGLRHGAAAGGRNPPDKTGFSFRDFGRSS